MIITIAGIQNQKQRIIDEQMGQIRDLFQYYDDYSIPDELFNKQIVHNNDVMNDLINKCSKNVIIYRDSCSYIKLNHIDLYEKALYLYNRGDITYDVLQYAQGALSIFVNYYYYIFYINKLINDLTTIPLCYSYGEKNLSLIQDNEINNITKIVKNKIKGIVNE